MKDGGISLGPDGVFFPEETEQSHSRINKEGLAERADTKLTPLGVSWTAGSSQAPIDATVLLVQPLCLERFWKEIKDVGLLSWFSKNRFGEKLENIPTQV